jgi:hypothetical protein
MTMPDHLQPGPSSARVWLARHTAGVCALAIGAITFLVLVLARHEIRDDPDLRIAAPGLAATVIAGALSLTRREPARWLVVAGLALAVMGIVFGWVLEAIVVVIVVGAILAAHS